MTLNYNTLIDQIPSSFFALIKSHVIFMTDSSNVLLGDTIFFFILFFSFASGAFLLNLRYAHSYAYNKTTAVIDICFTAALLYLFSPLMLLLLSGLFFTMTVRRSS